MILPLRNTTVHILVYVFPDAIVIIVNSTEALIVCWLCSKSFAIHSFNFPFFFFSCYAVSSLLCTGFSVVAASGGYSLVEVCGLLIAAVCEAQALDCSSVQFQFSHSVVSDSL